MVIDLDPLQPGFSSQARLQLARGGPDNCAPGAVSSFHLHFIPRQHGLGLSLRRPVLSAALSIFALRRPRQFKSRLGVPGYPLLGGGRV
jgi:hypothetical protein